MSAYSQTAGLTKSLVERLDPRDEMDKRTIASVHSYLNANHKANLPIQRNSVQKRTDILTFINQNPQVHYEYELSDPVPVSDDTDDEPATEPTPAPEPETPAPDPVDEAESVPEPPEMTDEDRELLLKVDEISFYIRQVLRGLYPPADGWDSLSRSHGPFHVGDVHLCAASLRSAMMMTLSWLVNDQVDLENVHHDVKASGVPTQAYYPDQARRRLSSRRTESDFRRYLAGQCFTLRGYLTRVSELEGISSDISSASDMKELMAELGKITSHKSPLLTIIENSLPQEQSSGEDDGSDEPAAPAAAPSNAGQPAEEEDLSLSVRFHSEVVGGPEEDEVQDQPAPTSQPVFARPLPVSVGEPMPYQAPAPLRFVGPSMIRLTEGEENVKIQLHAEGGQRPYSWNWEGIHGFYLVPDGRLGSYRILSEDVGEYTAHVVVTDRLGNQDEADIRIEVLPLEKPAEEPAPVDESPPEVPWLTNLPGIEPTPPGFEFRDSRRDDAPTPFTWTSRDDDAVHTGGFTREDMRALLAEQADSLRGTFVTRDEYADTVDAVKGLITNSRNLGTSHQNLAAQVAELNDDFNRVESLAKGADNKSNLALDASTRAEINSRKALAGPQSWINVLALGRLTTAVLGFLVGFLLFWYGVEHDWFDDIWFTDEGTVVFGAAITAVLFALFLGDIFGYRRTDSPPPENSRGFSSGARRSWTSWRKNRRSNERGIK